MNCERCDRPACTREATEKATKNMEGHGYTLRDLLRGRSLEFEATADCAAHSVDWRARAIAAEATRDRLTGQLNLALDLLKGVEEEGVTAEARVERLAGLLKAATDCIDAMRDGETCPRSPSALVADCRAALASEEPEEGPLDVDHPEAGK